MISLFRRKFARRIGRLPILVIMPHSGCNCRCVMCGYWQGERKEAFLRVEDLARQLDAFGRLRIRWFLFSGGEPLLHPDIWRLAAMLRPLDAKLTLLTNGLLLSKHSEATVRHFDEVIVSLDGGREVHDRIRGVSGSYEALERGVKALRAQAPSFPVSGRAVLQKANVAEFPRILDSARALGLDRISFLAVDSTTNAFARREIPGDLAPDADETEAFGRILDRTVASHAGEFSEGFVAESPKRLGRILRYFRAVNGKVPFEAPPCNAPWRAAVIEADGSVRPCFFHPPHGNIRDRDLDAILNSPEAIAFRRNLEIRNDPICRRCVCPLYLRSRDLR